ncbi:hypothetical protein MMC19_006238 [Ptychographa xylographoides]|nr:hypothetical protein [Ptychographa xylographoides]
MFTTTPQTTTSLPHRSLNGTLLGVQYTKNDVSLTQYRGVRYATVAKRFAPPLRVDDLGGVVVGCREFGPVCPQNHVDIRRLLRIPDEFEEEFEKEDEFECTNLAITLPSEATKATAYGKKLPVIIWIHDPSLLVATSVQRGKPMIVVSPNYRLNIFAFGARTGEKNLALQDQRCAIDWVVKHIGDFGGDKNNITIAGSSAGAVYTHAHTVLGAPIRRAILMSGSLYLSPPQPSDRCNAFLAPLEQLVREGSGRPLDEAPTAFLLEALRELGVQSMFLRETPELVGWRDKKMAESVEAVMVGDCEYESIIWLHGLRSLPAHETHALLSPLHPPLHAHYKLSASPSSPEPASSTSPSSLPSNLSPIITATSDPHPTPYLPGLSLISTALFHLPTHTIATRAHAAGKQTYQYIIDEPNPFDPTSRAHHGVDLLYLFGGYDLTFSTTASKVGREIRGAFIRFINGETAWGSALSGEGEGDGDGEERKIGGEDVCMAFGPEGLCKVVGIEGAEWRGRRDGAAMDLMRGREGEVGKVVGALAKGRVSLDN